MLTRKFFYHACVPILALILAACGGGSGGSTDEVSQCSVATELTDCGAHQYCNVGGAAPVCSCVAGYADGVNGCEWAGSVQDPGFMTGGSWASKNGASIDVSAIGDADPGEASFSFASMCDLGLVSQEVEMPTFESGEPLVLDLTYKNAYDFLNNDRVLMGVSFGGNWSPLPHFNDSNFHSTRICLPEGGYAPRGATGKGASVTLAFGPYREAERCPNSTVSNFAVDHAEIVVANDGECGAAPGQGPNFDAEGSGGWTFTTTGSSAGGFVDGLGVGGSRAASITRGARCDSASMETTINVPDVANPALDMFVGTSAGTKARIVFGPDMITTVAPPGGTSTTIRACLPPSLRGQMIPVKFYPFDAGGLCSEVLNDQIYVDDIQVVDDAACASNTNLTDPGFERGGTAFGSYGDNLWTTAQAVVRTDPNLARSGSNYLSLESFGRCSSSGLTLFPVVPAADGTDGPALKFHADVGVNPNATTSVRAYGDTSQTLTEGGGYRSYTVCLDPKYSGRTQNVTISHYGGDGRCDNSGYTQQNAFIDDLEVTTDASCPVP